MSDQNPPLISVVIPTCHRNDLLAKCLDCLAPGVQTLPPEQYKVIVTDDGFRSTAQALVQESYPWACWVPGPRKGPAANRNNGAHLAQGEWLAFTDDDCLPSTGWLEAFSSAIQAGTSTYEGKTICKQGLVSPLYEAPINLTGGNLWSCNFMIEQSVFQEVGGFDEGFTMPAVEDTDLRERLEKRGEKRRFVEAALVDHPPRRQPPGRRLGEKYEANIQYWYKTGNRGPYLVTYLKHIKHRLFLIRRFGASRDSGLALLSVLRELWHVLPRLYQWRKKYYALYSSTDDSYSRRRN